MGAPVTAGCGFCMSSNMTTHFSVELKRVPSSLAGLRKLSYGVASQVILS